MNSDGGLERMRLSSMEINRMVCLAVRAAFSFTFLLSESNKLLESYNTLIFIHYTQLFGYTDGLLEMLYILLATKIKRKQ